MADINMKLVLEISKTDRGVRVIAFTTTRSMNTDWTFYVAPKILPQSYQFMMSNSNTAPELELENLVPSCQWLSELFVTDQSTISDKFESDGELDRGY